jgi:hypothetical protein
MSTAKDNQELLRRLDGVNQVRGYEVPGGVVLSLSHRATDDEAMSVFVPGGKVVFWDRVSLQEGEELNDALEREIAAFSNPSA